MTNYLVRVRSYLPYPVDKQYRLRATNMGVAANRGYREFRKEINGKKLTKLAIQIIKL